MSSDKTKESRIETLKKTQEARKEDALFKVNKAIERLQKIGAKINFQTVAKEANVSVPYLYKYPELKAKVAQLRSEQTQMPPSPVIKPPVTAKAHSQVIGRIKQRVRQLEEENNELKRKNESLTGQVYRVHHLQSQVERQKEIIEDLQSRLEESQKQLSTYKVVPINANLDSDNAIIDIDNVKSNSKSKDIPESIKVKLSSLGVELNSRLKKLINAATEESVLTALDAAEEYIKTHQVKNLGGTIADAIKDRWKPSQISKPNSSQAEPSISPVSESESSDELIDLSQLKSLFKGLNNE